MSIHNFKELIVTIIAKGNYKVNNVRTLNVVQPKFHLSSELWGI